MVLAECAFDVCAELAAHSFDSIVGCFHKAGSAQLRTTYAHPDHAIFGPSWRSEPTLDPSKSGVRSLSTARKTRHIRLVITSSFTVEMKPWRHLPADASPEMRAAVEKAV